jgi:hypothetical protein
VKARPRTTTVRLTPGQARCLLHALRVLALTREVDRPEQLEELAEILRTAAT